MIAFFGAHYIAYGFGSLTKCNWQYPAGEWIKRAAMTCFHSAKNSAHPCNCLSRRDTNLFIQDDPAMRRASYFTGSARTHSVSLCPSFIHLLKEQACLYVNLANRLAICSAVSNPVSAENFKRGIRLKCTLAAILC